MVTLVASLVLLIPSFRKYAEYERSACVPRLRANIGERVQLPEQTLHVLGRDVTRGPHRGVLKTVRYRFNDKAGLFDVEVSLEAQREGDASVWTGLSPAEARKVIVRDEQ